MLLDVLLISPKELILETKANSVVVPGEEGVFEILPFHKPIISRLISGIIFIDKQAFSILRGIVRFNDNKVIIITEESSQAWR